MPAIHLMQISAQRNEASDRSLALVSLPLHWHDSDCGPLCFRHPREEPDLPRFRFHLYNDVETQDLEGRLFPDLRAARDEAVRCARSLMASELTAKGEISLRHWIEIETEEGDMHIVTFGDTVRVNS